MNQIHPENKPGLHRPFRLLRAVIVTLGLLALPLLCAEAGPLEKPGWKLTFQDEFDGDGINGKKWNLADPWGQERNQELQAYVKDAFEVKEGILKIKAEKRGAFYSGRQRSYASGMMTTYQKFQQRFGRFEIRCRVPRGKGLWPAFWLLPQPLGWPPEIDVLEILGHEPDTVHMTHHFMGADKKRDGDGGSWSGPDFSAAFHEFAVEWTPDRIVWFVDNVERFRSAKTIPKTKMYLLINLAVGGDWPGAPDSQTRFPASLEVDYVRVYEKSAK